MIWWLYPTLVIAYLLVGAIVDGFCNEYFQTPTASRCPLYVFIFLWPIAPLFFVFCVPALGLETISSTSARLTKRVFAPKNKEISAQGALSHMNEEKP